MPRKTPVAVGFRPPRPRLTGVPDDKDGIGWRNLGVPGRLTPPARHHTWLYLLGRDNAPGGRRLEVNGDGQVLTLSFSRRHRRGPTGSRPLGTGRIRTALCRALQRAHANGPFHISGPVCPGCHA